MHTPGSRSWLGTRSDAWALLVLVGGVLAFAVPLLAHPGAMRDPENGDTLNYYLHLELARRSIVEHGQFPWWTPFVRGGIPLVGHPRDVSVSPVILPALVLPPIAAVKVICIGIYLTGALGMFYLLRIVMGLSRVAAVAGAALLVTAVWLPARFVSGNYDEWHLVLFPLVLGFYLRSRDHWRYLIYGAAALYVTIIDGKYVVAIFGLYLGLLAAAEVVRSAVARRLTVWPLGRLVGMFALAALLAAVKIVPMAQLMRNSAAQVAASIEDPPVRWGAGWIGLRALDAQHENFGTDTYDLGTGFLAPLLFLAACVLDRRRMLGWVALLVLSLWLMCSQLVPGWMDLFALLHKLPVLSAMRKPFKYFNFFVLFVICVGVAHALAWVGRGTGLRRVAAAGLALATVGVPLAWHIRIQAWLFRAPAKGPPVKWEGEFHSAAAVDPLEFARQVWRQTGMRIRLDDVYRFLHERPEEVWRLGRAYKDYFFVRAGLGLINWYDPMDLPCHAMPRYTWLGDARLPETPGYLGEVFLASGARVRWLGGWSPLALTVDLDPGGEDTLIVNQNFNRRWRATVYDREGQGAPADVEERAGLLSVRVPEGTARVRLRYVPVDHYLAAAASGLAVLGCVCALAADWRRRRRRSAACRAGRPAVE